MELKTYLKCSRSYSSFLWCTIYCNFLQKFSSAIFPRYFFFQEHSNMKPALPRWRLKSTTNLTSNAILHNLKANHVPLASKVFCKINRFRIDFYRVLYVDTFQLSDYAKLHKFNGFAYCWRKKGWIFGILS